MKKNQQQGSTQMIIVVGLVVVLLGALGFIVWQNFIQKPSALKQTSLQDSSKSQKKQVVKTHEYCAQLEKICVDVPEDWTIDAQVVSRYDGEPDAYSADAITFTSPSKTVNIKLETGLGGLGGGCQPEDTAGSYSSTMKWAVLPINTSDYNSEYSVPNLYAIATINQTGDGKFTPMLQITSNKIASQVGKHQICDVFMAPFFVGRNVDTGITGSHGAMTFKSSDDMSYGSFDKANSKLEGKDYQAAYKILTTANYK